MYNDRGYSLIIDLDLLAPQEKSKIPNYTNTIKLDLSQNSCRDKLLWHLNNTIHFDNFLASFEQPALTQGITNEHTT